MKSTSLPPGCLDHAALAARMGWSSVAVARTLSSRSNRRRQEGTPRPGDLPPPDGRAGRIAYWREETIAAWEATRPSAIAENRNHGNGLKTCSKCGETKPITEYHTAKDKRRPELGERFMAKCKTCHSKVALAWNERNPERAAAATAKWKKKTRRKYKARAYGLAEVELAAMEAAQQGHCLICRQFAPDGLVVDHDHETGHVRGLLCSPCNLGLGAFRDDPKRLLRAARYLQKSRDAIFAQTDGDGASHLT